MAVKARKGIKSKRCHWCKRTTIGHQGDNDPLTLTIDHVMPLGKGGGNQPANKVPCCHQCNTMKGGMSPETWEAFMRGNPRWWKKFECKPVVYMAPINAA